MSGIDNVISFYRLLNVPSVTGLIDGGIWRYNRPLNSQFTDVVISTPDDKLVEINVHTPNIQNFFPLGYEDGTHPDVQKLQSVTDAIISELSGYNLKTVGKVSRDSDGHWHSSITVQFVEVDGQLVELSLIEYTSVDDGYGGSIPDKDVAWVGDGFLVNVANNVNDLNIDLGRYEVNPHIEFAIPKTSDVKKNMSIELDGIEHVIVGIRPIIGNSDYLSIKTVRQ